jgi:hypothetical protein
VDPCFFAELVFNYLKCCHHSLGGWVEESGIQLLTIPQNFKCLLQYEDGPWTAQDRETGIMIGARANSNLPSSVSLVANQLERDVRQGMKRSSVT